MSEWLCNFTVCITLSDAWQSSEKQHTSMISNLSNEKKKLGLLVKNGFLIFLDHISLIVTMNECEATEPNNSHSRITTSITNFTKYAGQTSTGSKSNDKKLKTSRVAQIICHCLKLYLILHVES